MACILLMQVAVNCYYTRIGIIAQWTINLPLLQFLDLKCTLFMYGSATSIITYYWVLYIPCIINMVRNN